VRQGIKRATSKVYNVSKCSSVYKFVRNRRRPLTKRAKSVAVSWSLLPIKDDLKSQRLPVICLTQLEE
jgi:hypothetical protein